MAHTTDSIRNRLYLVATIMAVTLLANAGAVFYTFGRVKLNQNELKFDLLPIIIKANDLVKFFDRYNKQVELALSLQEPDLTSENRSLYLLMQSTLDELTLHSSGQPNTSVSAWRDDLRFYHSSVGTMFARLRASQDLRDVSDTLRVAGQQRDLLNGKFQKYLKWQEDRLSTILDESDHEMRRIFYTNLIILLAVGAITIGLIFVILKKMLERIEEFKAKVTQIDLRNLTAARWHSTYQDEFTPLEEAVNRMIGSLELSRKDLVDREWVESIFSSVGDLLFVTDMDGIITRANKSSCIAFESTSEDFLGKHIFSLFEAGHPPPWSDILSGIQHQHYYISNMTALHKSNHMPVIGVVSSIRDNLNSITATVWSLRNVSELKRMEHEREVMMSRLIQTSKLAAIGTMGAGVAHELNNPLFAAKGFAELLRMRIGEGEYSSFFDKMDRSFERMKRIINHLRSFATDTSQREFQTVALAKVIDESLIFFEQKISMYRIELKVEILHDLPEIQGDFTQLESVLQNLLANSIDAFAERTDQEELDCKISIRCRGDRSTHTVSIHYEDNAGGIPLAVQPRIFDPFFTTKDVGKGTGLGLSLCHNIMKEHHGTIIYHNTKPGSAIFEMRLPSLKREDERDELPNLESIVIRHRGIKIAVVDDEEIVTTYLEAILKPYYEVVCFNDSKQALVDIQKMTFDLLITDVQMPNLNGFDMVAILRAFNYRIPILIISAEPYGKTDREQFASLGIYGLVEKPILSANPMLTMIESVMDKKKIALAN